MKLEKNNNNSLQEPNGEKNKYASKKNSTKPASMQRKRAIEQKPSLLRGKTSKMIVK